MRMLRHLWASLRRGRLDDEMREELDQHRAWKTEELESDGIEPGEARRLAAVAVGNVARLREDSRAVWGFPRIDTIVQDVQYGLRQMRHAPLFTAIAVASLAIGIGASGAVFGLSDRLLLDKLPVRDPDSLVVLKWTSGPATPFSSLNGNSEQHEDGSIGSTSFSRAAFDAMRGVDGVDVFAFADLYDVNITIDGRAEQGNAHVVSGNYFEVLGVAPAAGRTLGPSDDRPDAAPAAVISDALWTKRFGRSAGAIGRTLAVNGLTFTIAGVAPRGFAGTAQVIDAPDVFVPLSAHGRIGRADDDNDPNNWWVLVIGRLRPGSTAGEVRPALDLVVKQTTASAKPALTAKDLPKLTLLDGSRGQHEERDGMREPLRTMAGVVSIVLLVACANVANLLLARGRARVRELSVRTALGAPRGRMVRQLFTEGALLAAFGAALGALSANWMTAALLPALTSNPAASPGGLNWRRLAFLIALAGGCAILFALAPAIRSTRLILTSGLREASRRGAGGTRQGWFSGTLVVAQIALSMMLVVTAALLVRSLRNLDQTALGFDSSNLLVFRVDPGLNGYDDDRVRSLYASIRAALVAAPGVQSATFTDHPLLSHASSIGVGMTEGEAAPQPGSADAQAFQKGHLVWRLRTGPDFFKTLGIPMLRGRALDERDVAGSQRAAVINAAYAKQLFHDIDVVGRRFRLGMRANAPLYEIVGVSADAKYTAVRDDAPPTAYLAAAQQPPGPATFEARTSGPAEALAPVAREIVRGIDDQIPLVGTRTMAEQIGESMRQERLFARLALLLGAVTLALSAIGLYGLLAYGVAQRVPEIGIRMALGAERTAVKWMVLRQSLRLAVLGLVAGGAGALAGTGVVQSLLYNLPPRDPMAFAGAGAIMLATCVLAGYVPALRASRVDPIVALRAD